LFITHLCAFDSLPACNLKYDILPAKPQQYSNI
jgi:hypothetical protein